ncbi:(Na+)-NQR maturation NqrM [Shewanella avicenniae]|uniref:(Na+)-NQR maturation NqrM n=1 Tax=Shewanella avicenniae TaxID=2814294 RepID=A0ABX7QT47_9GAMM|nr:(Na+)-NQR maturation NqrM [Shewanella avicenniae]QSX34647.1 (Na+)-NQR maturation NqrM [Shewanella avicenniae]
MATFLAAFIFLLVFFLLMSIGYLVKRKAVQGSCGGLGALGIEKACDCDEPCDRRKAREAKELARQEKLNKHRII